MPHVSVLVHSFKHRRYLWHAIDSAVKQENAIPAEIILLTHGASPTLPASLQADVDARRIPLRRVQVDANNRGAALRAGFETATSDFVALLDDDDAWELQRLQTVSTILSKFPDAIYIHNGQTFVDDHDIPLPITSLHRLVRHPSTLRQAGQILTFDTRDEHIAPSVRRFEPGFNASSIVVRREVVLPVLADLATLTADDDSFMLCCGLRGRGRIVLLSDRLTRYRIHRQGATFASGSVRPGETEATLVDYIDGHRQTYETIKGWLRDVDAPPLRSFVESEGALWDSLYSVMSGYRKRNTLRQQVHALILSGVLRPTAREIGAATLGLLSGLLPRTTRGLFLASRMAW
jgi:glycosyltransferase involved in cell wall biosynthesis